MAGKNISSKKWSLFFTNIANIYMRKVQISRKKSLFLAHVRSASESRRLFAAATAAKEKRKKERAKQWLPPKVLRDFAAAFQTQGE